MDLLARLTAAGIDLDDTDTADALVGLLYARGWHGGLYRVRMSRPCPEPSCDGGHLYDAERHHVGDCGMCGGRGSVPA